MRKSITVLLAGLCTIFLVANASATNPEKRMCLKEAGNNAKVCRNVCKEISRQDRIECGGNPDCHKACRATLEACVKPFEDALAACIDGCATAFEAGRVACKAEVGCSGDCYRNAAFLSCLRPVGLASFTCKHDCRDAQRLDTEAQAAIKACKVADKACHKACVLPKATSIPEGIHE